MRNILFLGDSITDAGHAFDYEDLGEGYVRMIWNTLRKLNHKYHVYNRGTDGFTVANVKRFWNFYYNKLSPDMITILVGINDISVMKGNHLSQEESFAKFEETYDALLTDIRKVTDCPIILMEPFIFPHPAEFVTWEPDVRAMGKVIQKLAAKHHLHFLPLLDLLLEAAKENGLERVTTDGIHLTRQGHHIIAETWLSYFSKLNQ